MKKLKQIGFGVLGVMMIFSAVGINTLFAGVDKVQVLQDEMARLQNLNNENRVRLEAKQKTKEKLEKEIQVLQNSISANSKRWELKRDLLKLESNPIGTMGFTSPQTLGGLKK